MSWEIQNFMTWRLGNDRYCKIYKQPVTVRGLPDHMARVLRQAEVDFFWATIGSKCVTEDRACYRGHRFEKNSCWPLLF